MVGKEWDVKQEKLSAMGRVTKNILDPSLSSCEGRGLVSHNNRIGKWEKGRSMRYTSFNDLFSFTLSGPHPTPLINLNWHRGDLSLYWISRQWSVISQALILLIHHFWMKPHLLLRPWHSATGRMSGLTNSPYLSAYISLSTNWKNSVKTSRHFIFGDHFPNSHDLYVLYCTDIIRQNLMLITIKALRVNP